MISRRLSDSAPQINQTVEINSHGGHMMAARQVDNRMPAFEQLQSWCRQVGEFMKRTVSGPDGRRWQAPVVGWSLVLLTVLT